MRRLQMETLVEAAATQERRKTLIREQKMMDRWFLSSRPRPIVEPTDESFQREQPALAECSGTTRAKSVHG
jgi:hypothetical protein